MYVDEKRLNLDDPLSKFHLGVHVPNENRITVRELCPHRMRTATTWTRTRTGTKGLSFGLGIGCSGGWFGYTGGLPGCNTAAYYLPAKDATIIAFVTAQREKREPGVANSILRDIARIVFPSNVPFP